MDEQEKRETRILDAPFLTYDLQDVLARLKQEEAWKRSDRNSITLNMGAGLRAVVVALHQGALIKQDKAEHPISVHVLEGEMEFLTEAGSAVLEKGELLTLRKGIPHSVEARKECAFLLTFGG